MEQKDIINVPVDDLDLEIDQALAPVKFDKQNEEIIQGIIDANDKEELTKQFDLFNMNQSKKNALRLIKLEGLLNKVEDQAIKRFEERPDQVSNRELLDYMQVVSAQIERSQKVVDSIHDKPMIKAVQNNTEINVNLGTELDRDSKANVVSAIKGIIGLLQKGQTVEEPVNTTIISTTIENTPIIDAVEIIEDEE